MVAVLGASGLLATVAGLYATKNFGNWSDDAADLLGADAIVIYPDPVEDPRPGPFNTYAFAGTLKELQKTSKSDRFGSLLADHGATDLGRLTRGVTLENKRSETVTFTSIRAKAERHSPLEAAYVYAVYGGGSTDGPIDLGFDLDSQDLRARVMKDNEVTDEVLLDSSGIDLKSGEKLRLRMTGTTEKSFVEWNVEFTFILDGKSQVIQAMPDGQPLRVTAKKSKYSETYRWSPTYGLKPCPSAAPDSCQNVEQ